MARVLIAFPGVFAVTACAAKPVRATAKVLMTTDGGVYWREFLRPYGPRLLLPIAFGAVTYCAEAISWLLWPGRGVGERLFGPDADLGWPFPLLWAVLDLAAAFLVLHLLITPLVAAYDAYSQRSTAVPEAMRLSGYVIAVIGFALTIGAQIIASPPGEDTSDRVSVLVDEVRLLAWHSADGIRGVVGSTLAWVGIAAGITTAAIFIRANRVRRA